MAVGNISPYEGSANAANVEKLVGSEGQVYVKVYNNTGSAISNGAIYIISFAVDATDTSNPFMYAYPVTPATNAVATNIVGVCDNSPLEQSTIAASAYGYFCISGYTTALVNGNVAVAVGDQLEILNTGTAFTLKTQASSGKSGVLGITCSAIALQAYSTNANALKKVFVVGQQCNVAAS